MTSTIYHMEFGHYETGGIDLPGATNADWRATSCAVGRFTGRDFKVPKSKPDLYFKIVPSAAAARPLAVRVPVRVRQALHARAKAL